MKKLSILFSAAAASALLFTSCGNKQEEEKPIDMEMTKDTIKSEARIDLQLVRTNVPSPNTLSHKLSAAGLNYKKDMLNPSGKSGSYSGAYKQALNLGVYGADMGYASSYNQTSDVTEYLAQTMKLGKDLGIESAFDPEFAKKAGSIKPDSMDALMDAAFEKAERNLRSNQRVAKLALIITGGWVEGLYVGLNAVTSNTDPKKKKEVQDITHDLYVHTHAFDYVTDLLKQYSKDADCQKMLDEMKAAQPTLKKYGIMPQVKPEELGELKDAVTALRNKIVN